ncbi:MAG: FAD-dependent oxidoreductase, partial [Ottowia sp.]|nr:FAD-dependent oxidoreductase [Ottowia sp.]
ERHAQGKRRLPPEWNALEETSPAHPGIWSAAAPITQQKAQLAGVPLGDAAGSGEEALTGALWHAHGGWLRPVQLVRAMLKAPGVQWKGGQRATRLEQVGAIWRVLDENGEALAEAELLLLCAGFGTRALLQDGTLPLQALRGQVAWGELGTDAAPFPPFPVSGCGSLIAGVPIDAPDAPGSRPLASGWLAGATVQRDADDRAPRTADHTACLRRLATLHPAAATALAPQWNTGEAQPWTGIRAVLPDHLPAVGAWMDDGAAHAPDAPLPPHLLCGLGVRGITLAVLAAELIAAQLYAEPLPIARSLAAKLRASRWRRA